MKKKIALYAGIILGFLVLAYAFVPQVLSGKRIDQMDGAGWRGGVQEMVAWDQQHPEDRAEWSGSMFSGMPAVGIEPPVKGDLSFRLYRLMMSGKAPANWLFICLLGSWLLLLVFGVNPLIAAGGAIAMTFCSYNIQIIQVGHNNKMQAIALMPYVLGAAAYAYRKALEKKIPQVLLGAALFGLFISFQIKAHHPQISYYLAIMLLCFILAEFIALVANKERRHLLGRFFAVSFLLLGFGLVGLGTNAAKLLPTFEYTPYTMRGGSSSGETKGLDLDYATAWSYGWEELPNLMIPDFNGGASAGELGPDSQTYKLFRRAGQNAREICKSLPLYWGPQPFTAGPMYMGAISVFLFLLGLCCCKGRERWWMLAATIIAVLLSLGNHFMPFTRLVFKYLPLYNKFRAVSMSLVVLQFTLPLLGFIALDKVRKGGIGADEFLRKSLPAFVLTAGFCLLCWLFPGIAGDYHASMDGGMQKILSDALAADRASLMRHDAMTGFLLISASWLLLWWASRQKDASAEGRRLVACGAVCLLVLVNLFSVGKRYLNDSHFTTERAFTGQFTQRLVDKFILQDPDPSYRVLDLTVNVFNDSHPSFWHKNIGGYSAVKMQLYQEYIDSHLAREISLVQQSLSGKKTLAEAEAALPYMEGLAKLNCRYIIVDGNAAPLRYGYARGNAWFEDGEGTIEMTEYSPNTLKYHYSRESAGKAVFSEVYFPKNWTLTVEGSGEKLQIELSDEVLRSAVLPAGEHDLVMHYHSRMYPLGASLSYTFSLIIILLVLGSLGFIGYTDWRRRNLPAANVKKAE